ncbi:MinD/ParA family protein [Arthrobacter sp. NQ4]|nr:MinD/ParA family protein [Arthrobacter sp. NQ4]MDE8585917.1 MinD/ParA family protein [Arthrobacter sp. NQ4]
MADAIADSPMPDFITSPGLFVKEQKPRPKGGIRGVLYNLTGGAWNLGPGPKQRQEDELARRISRQLQGSFNTAILSLKGGIGKTSTTVGVGLTLAEYRGDAPCAIDANPDSGDLVERALGEGIYQQSSPRTITDLLENIEFIDSLTALARYMHHAGRLHLIAGEQDPEVSDSLTAAEYLRIRQLIASYYSVALTDCGTGVTHNAMSGILQSADNLVIAAGYAVSGAKRARSTLHWLASHGYEDLARNAIVVITDKDEVSSRVDKDAIEEHLSGICRELIAVPHDRGVADGDLVTLDVLRPETRRAYKEIAAAIVDGYR